jgi:hypothetical protein
MAFADHGIALPVTEAPPGINNGRTLINRDLVGDTPAPVVAAIALAAGPLAPQIPWGNRGQTTISR